MRGITVVLFAYLSGAALANNGVRLINGTEVPAGSYKEVGQITLGAARCTGVLVGPRVIITAASCGITGTDLKIKLNGTEYAAKMTRSPLFDPTSGTEPPHDIGLAILSQDVSGVDPVNILKNPTAQVGNALQLLGYGCTQIGGAFDNKLREGNTAITMFTKYTMQSRKENGAALCFGDLGGPAYVTQNNKKYLLGVNSTGNMKDLNYSVRMDIADSSNWISQFASANNVTICGINQDCGGVAPTAPTCNMNANPTTVKVGGQVVVTLMASSNAKSAMIDGQTTTLPTGSRTYTASQKGMQTINGSVSNEAGTGNCQTSFMVEDNPQPTMPTCTLAAIPSQIKLGNSLQLDLRTFNATSAKLDGQTADLPNFVKTITPTSKGTFTARGDVSNAQGSGSCTASYVVSDDTPPDTPNFAAVPAFCGDNSLNPASKVKKVCVAVTRNDSTIGEVILRESAVIHYDDGRKEIMPFIARTRKAGKFAGQVVDDLWFYTNNPIDMGQYYVYETKSGFITRNVSNERGYLRGEIPIAIEGRSKEGWYFIVNQLSPTGVSK